MIAQATRAVRLAAATVATRTGLRCSSAGSRGSTEVGVAFARRIREVIAAIDQASELVREAA